MAEESNKENQENVSGTDFSGKDSIDRIYDSLCAGGDDDPSHAPISLHELNDREREDRIRSVCVRKTGDSQYYDILDFRYDPITAIIRALRRRAPVYVDTEAMRRLILEEIGEFCPSPEKIIPQVVCVSDISGAETLSQNHSISLPGAGILLRKDNLAGSVLVIGKDEEALLTVCRLAERSVAPSAIIGFIAGNGNQNRSKAYLREMNGAVPSISTKSAKGGREAAAICFAEIVKICYEDLKMSGTLP